MRSSIGSRRWGGRRWMALGVALLAAACAGKDFTRPAPDTLVLGKTTRAPFTASGERAIARPATA